MLLTHFIIVTTSGVLVALSSVQILLECKQRGPRGKMGGFSTPVLNETLSVLHVSYFVAVLFMFQAKDGLPQKPGPCPPWPNPSIPSKGLGKTTYCFLRIMHADNVSQYNGDPPEPPEITTTWCSYVANHVAIYTSFCTISGAYPLGLTTVFCWGIHR